MTHRVLVCGGRDYCDKTRLFEVLTHYNHEAGGFACIIHGAARGADTLAGEWAALYRVPVQVFPANWNRDGNAAGPIRNAQMLREGNPTLCIAFPGGTGTADMVRKCRLAKVPVLQVPL